MTDLSTPQPEKNRSPGSAASFRERLLVDAFLWLDSIDPDSARDADAERRGIESPAAFESKLVSMATSFRHATPLQHALRDVRSALTLIVTGALLLAFVSGAGAARAALGAPRGEPVNFYFVLAGLLGVQSLMLMLWIALAALKSRRQSLLRNLSLGGVILRLASWTAGRFHRSHFHAAAASATTTALASGPLGRWTLGSISHAFWAMFNIGCLVMVIALLSAKQYVFVWETTILSPQAYVPMTRALAALPEALGFPAPNPKQIEASRLTNEVVQPPEVSQAWSGLLVGSLVCYGFGPRILLLGFCLGQRRLAKSKYRLDETRAEIVRWQQRLVREAQVQTPSQAATFNDAPSQIGADHADPRPIGPPAIVAIELQLPRKLPSWPPSAHDVRWTDLGFVETRDDQQRVIRNLETAGTRPAAVVAVCSLLTTPDRGIRSFLEEMRGASAAALKVILTGGQALRQRAHSAAVLQRIDDWRSMAQRVGAMADDVIELDLDHYTHTSGAQMARLVGRSANGESRSHMEQAFELICRFAAHPYQEIAALERAEAALHADIARLYRGAVDQWRQFIGWSRSVNLASAPAVAEQLRTSAQRMIDHLPSRLRGSHRWLAAGAAAGAIGCLAAATLISPVALTALPAWSAMGAAISAALKLYGGGSSTSQESVSDVSQRFDRAVRSAALLSLVLELQGRGEKTITRILDQTIAEEPDEPHLQPSDVPAWLARIRARFIAADSVEGRP